MSNEYSEQSVWVAPGIIGHETELGYDVLRGIELAKVMSESLRKGKEPGDATLKHEYGTSAVETIGEPISQKDYVMRDAQSGLYLKAYPDTRDAELQFAVMNTLSRKLLEYDVGVQAVQHFALIERAGDTPVAVIQPAQGTRLYQMDRPKKEIRAMLKDVRTRLDTALGRRASRALVNDLDRMQNFGGNVFLGDDGSYMLIDQPVFQLANRKRAREIVVEAGWPLPLAQSSWVDLLSFDPHDPARLRSDYTQM